MSKVLTSARGKKPAGGSSGASLHSMVSSTSQSHHAEPIIIEMGDQSEQAEEFETDKVLCDVSNDQNEIPLQMSSSLKIAQEYTQPQQLSKIAILKRFCRKIYKKFGLKYLITFFMMVIYTVIGAVLFLSFEKAHDQKRVSKLHENYFIDRQEFAKNMSVELLNNIQNISDITMLTRFIDEHLIEYDNNHNHVPNNETMWNFWHAMYFAGTIYTTIGYGDIFCRTKSGRIATMLYSLVGIPLMLITLTDLGSLLLKFMFALTQFCSFCKAKCSPSAILGPHPPGYDQKPVKYKMTRSKDDGDEMTEMGTRDEEFEDIEDMKRRDDEDFEYQLTRVPVLTALSTTIAWIFICAGLFCFWEDWDYFTSVYFFFISLSTIGLGDETPHHKDIMVATYIFVIIGLSLVSMCITVIQRRLEDLYFHLLQMILREYQRKLNEGQDQLGATVGMMNAWQNSKTARFLMPLLSKDKKKNVAKKFQDEAKAQGVVLPAVLRDLDPKSGVPAVLQVTTDKNFEGNSDLQAAVNDAILRATAKARALNEPVEDEMGLLSSSVITPINFVQAEEKEITFENAIVAQPKAILYDSDAQTDELESEDKQEQTTIVTLMDAQTQSLDTSIMTNARVDATSQTPIVELDDSFVQCQIEDDNRREYQEREIQTEKLESREMTSQTTVVDYNDSNIQCRLEEPRPPSAEKQAQTELLGTNDATSQTVDDADKEIVRNDQDVQTEISDQNEAGIQTDQLQTKNQRLQTPAPEFLDHEVQTDPLVLDLEQFQATGTLSIADRPGEGGWAKAKKNIKQAIKKATSSSKLNKQAASGTPTVSSLAGIEPTPTMASWSDVVGGDDDDEGEDEEEEIMDLPRRASEESLHWDPVDGLHAEPQRKVGDLKRMFEKPTRPKPRQGSIKKYY